VAVGLAGMGALEDWRGRPDGDGRLLEVTEVAVADEVAAAADLVKGKASRVPAALLRGVPRPKGDGSARDLVRPPADDLFRTAGTVEDLLAFLEGGGAPSRFLTGPVDPAVVQRAVVAASTVPLPGGRRFGVVPVPAAARARCLASLSPAEPPGPLLASAPTLLAPCLDLGEQVGPHGGRAETVALAAGGAVRTLLLALHAQGVAAAFLAAGPEAGAELAAALGLPASAHPLGLLAAGRPG